MIRTRLIGVNEHGYRVGEDHHLAKLTDHDVDLIRELREEHRMSYRQLAEKFDVAIRTIRDICRYRIRAQVPVRWRRVL